MINAWIRARRIEPADRQQRAPGHAGVVRPIQVTWQRSPLVRNTNPLDTDCCKIEKSPKGCATFFEGWQASRITGGKEKLCGAIVVARAQERLGGADAVFDLKRAIGERLNPRRCTLPFDMPALEIAFANPLGRRHHFTDLRTAV